MLGTHHFPNERVILRTFTLACVAASIACGTDQGVEPTQTPQVFTVLHITPTIAYLEPGSTVIPTVVTLDQRGLPIFPRLITYSSNAPAIASVNSGGMVTAITPGAAEILVTVTIGSSSKSALMTANVFEHIDSGQVVLKAGADGWQPDTAYVIAGGVVEWRTGPTDWAGSPMTRLWVFDGDFYFVLDTVHLRNGSATRRFDDPGLFRYCSGGCWDYPDFGVIVVQRSFDSRGY